MKMKNICCLMGLSLFWVVIGASPSNLVAGTDGVVASEKIDRSVLLEEIKKEAILDIGRSLSRSTNLKDLKETRIVLLFVSSQSLFGQSFDLKQVMKVFEELVSEIDKQYERRKQEIEKSTTVH